MENLYSSIFFHLILDDPGIILQGLCVTGSEEEDRRRRGGKRTGGGVLFPNLRRDEKRMKRFSG